MTLKVPNQNIVIWGVAWAETERGGGKLEFFSTTRSYREGKFYNTDEIFRKQSTWLKKKNMKIS